MDIHDNGDDVYIFYTSAFGDDMEAILELLETNLGVNPHNIYATEFSDPITHKTPVFEDIIRKLEDINPDEVFIQGWCGSHPDHEMTHIEVVKAVEMAGVDPAIYEYPTWTYYYGPKSSSCPPIEELSDFYNNLIPLDDHYHLVNPNIQVAESEDALQAKLDLVVNWGIEWMMGLINCPNYEEEDIKDFMSQEKYRLLGGYDYLERPYDGEMSYELKYDRPFVFEDLRNYTLCLEENYGADLWTIPSATFGKYRKILSEGVHYHFQVGLANKAYEQDCFTLSAAWGENRMPANQVTFDITVVTLEGREASPPAYNFTLNTTGLAGKITLWIKAESQNMKSDPESKTDYVEVPFMIEVI